MWFSYDRLTGMRADPVTVLSFFALFSVACEPPAPAALSTGSGEPAESGCDARRETAASDADADAASDAASDAALGDAADASVETTPPCFCDAPERFAVCAAANITSTCATSATMCESNPYVLERFDDGGVREVDAAACVRVGDVMCCP